MTNHPLSNPSERPRGIFTPEVDRTFLVNHDGSPSDRAEYTRHEKIRQRLLNGIIDFRLAQHHLGEWNWRKFLDLDNTQDRDLRNGMAAAMALFYEIHHAKDWSFNKTLTLAIEDAYSTGVTVRTMPHKYVKNVDLEVDVREPTQYGDVLERVSQKLEEDVELTDREVHFAVKQGWFRELDEHYSREKRRERSLDDRMEKMTRWIDFGGFEGREETD